MNTLRKITAADCEIELIVTPEHIPVEGNALASGDDEADRQAEQAIYERMDRGDVWAWASVEVQAKFGPLTGHDHLGCCSYADEADFRQPGGYFDDMVAEAVADVQRQLDELLAKLDS